MILGGSSTLTVPAEFTLDFRKVETVAQPTFHEKTSALLTQGSKHLKAHYAIFDSLNRLINIGALILLLLAVKPFEPYKKDGGGIKN